MQENLLELLMHIFGGISMLCSCIVIAIYALNPSIRSHISNEIIFYIGISDLLSAAGGVIGFVHENTFLCQYQAILTNIFPLTGIFWTSLLVYVMIGLVANTKVLTNISWKLHLIGWTFPIILTLLPLTTNRYGVAGDNNGWCFIDRLESSPAWSTLFWMIISFYLWIWLSEIFFAGFAVYLLYIHYIQKLILPSGRQYLLNSLVLYPISSFFCWIFPCYDDIFYTLTSSNRHNFIDRESHRHDNISTYLAYLTPLFQGFFTCFIFIIMNHDVRYLVIQFLDRILFTLSCGKCENVLTGLLMRCHHSPRDRNQDRNNLIFDERYSESKRDQRSRFDLTSKETITSEYEIQGTLKENFEECSVVIC
jgi:hypothetical protein